MLCNTKANSIFSNTDLTFAQRVMLSCGKLPVCQVDPCRHNSTCNWWKHKRASQSKLLARLLRCNKPRSSMQAATHPNTNSITPANKIVEAPQAALLVKLFFFFSSSFAWNCTTRQKSRSFVCLKLRQNSKPQSKPRTSIGRSIPNHCSSVASKQRHSLARHLLRVLGSWFAGCDCGFVVYWRAFPFFCNKFAARV